MKTAKLFTNGRSQAVRLPKEYRFSGSDVYIRSFEGVVMLLPRKHPWESLINSLDMFSDDFMSDRKQPEQQDRRGL